MSKPFQAGFHKFFNEEFLLVIRLVIEEVFHKSRSVVLNEGFSYSGDIFGF